MERRDSVQLVVFELDGNEYGIDALKVNGILRAKKFSIKKMPGVSDSVEGIINLRGKVSFIFNLGKKFHIPTTVVDQESKFIMINIENVVVGCIVDEETTKASPTFVKQDDYIKGIVKVEDRIIIILDSDQIITKDGSESLDLDSLTKRLQEK
ncbi:MAG: purine-binding chemotaxis protein CheW [Selenomonas sp.]|nr:purine-binding chemotaxis protein CheW [Selenomonas sp.]